ncbi:MAG: TonB family protein [Pyrinomonadaceae bacterium]
MARNLFYLILFFLFSAQYISAQKKETISINSSLNTKSVGKVCKDLRLGNALLLPEPKYPSEAKQAKTGGTIEVEVELDENGNALRVEQISGNKVLQGAAVVAAMKAKFVPTLCDGVKTRISAVITYTFTPGDLLGKYVFAAKIEDLADVKNDSQFYQAILDLTENYHLAYGYADGNFHAELPLTRGDFAHFLRLTLDLLSTRAKFANKDLRQNGIFSAFNPQKTASVVKIKELKTKEPFYESVKLLLQNYDVSLVNENSEFMGNESLTQNEVIDLWTQIFGAEDVPVNFKKTENFERIISRGDFAVFLQESLGILTYKLLP